MFNLFQLYYVWGDLKRRPQQLWGLTPSNLILAMGTSAMPIFINHDYRSRVSNHRRRRRRRRLTNQYPIRNIILYPLLLFSIACIYLQSFQRLHSYFISIIIIFHCMHIYLQSFQSLPSFNLQFVSIILCLGGFEAPTVAAVGVDTK